MSRVTTEDGRHWSTPAGNCALANPGVVERAFAGASVEWKLSVGETRRPRGGGCEQEARSVFGGGRDDSWKVGAGLVPALAQISQKSGRGRAPPLQDEDRSHRHRDTWH